MYAVKIPVSRCIKKEEKFLTYELLVNWLSSFNYQKFYDESCRSRVGNRLLERAITPGGGNSGDIRNVLISDLETNENLYSRELIHDVTAHTFSPNVEAERKVREEKLRHEAYLDNRYGSNFLGFRNGPVPTTGAPSGGYYFRHVKTFPAHRDAANAEAQQFVRAKRKNTPSLWDDQIISRAGVRSWKDTTRDRKQWMRRVKNSSPSKGKGLYVSRPEERREPVHRCTEYTLCDGVWKEIA